MKDLNTSDSDLNMETPEETVDIYIESIALCALEETFPNFNLIPDKLQELFNKEYQNVFLEMCVHDIACDYINDITFDSFTNFDEFSKKCNEFKKSILELPEDILNEHPYIKDFRQLISLYNEKSILDLKNQYNNWKHKFWNSFVTQHQHNFCMINKLPNNDSISNSHIIDIELPFFCILFFIYYLGNYSCPVDEGKASIPFSSLKQIISSSKKKHFNIAQPLEWTIIIFRELYDTNFNFFSPDAELDISYVYGLPIFLSRYYYQEISGKKMLLDNLIYLFEHSGEDSMVKLTDHHKFVSYINAACMSTYVDNPKIFKKQRSDEIQLKLRTDTRYIKTALIEYFDKVFDAYEISNPSTFLSKYLDKKDNMTPNVPLLAAQFYANLLLSIANWNDDLYSLPYINIKYLLFNFVLASKRISFSAKDKTDYCMAQIWIKQLSELLINYFYTNDEDIYLTSVNRHYNEAFLESGVSSEAWDRHIENRYLHSFHVSKKYETNEEKHG